MEKLKKQKQMLKDLSSEVDDFKDIPKVNELLLEIHHLAKDAGEFEIIYESNRIIMIY